MSIDWHIKGRQFGNCNCNYGCPCQFNAPPTDNYCHGIGAFLIDEGFFKIDNEELKFIKKNFAAVTINDTETLRIIKDFYVKHSFVLDPHTATAVGAAHKIKNDSKTVVLGTAHPYKFLDTIKLAIEKNLEPPKQLGNLKDKVEKFDIIDSNLESIKEYILKKIR